MTLLPLCLSVLTDREEDLLKTLHDRHLDALQSVALSYTNGNVTQAEDLLQDMWVYVIERIDRLQFDNPRAEFTYLRNAIRYRALDMHKKLRRERAFGEAHEDMDAFVAATSAEHAVCEADVRSRVADLIERLDPIDRDVLALSVDALHTTEEIARLLHIRKGTVKSRLHRARARLKESMRREGLLDE